jgi:tetratricopeptide (TPR) repeat protein
MKLPDISQKLLEIRAILARSRCLLILDNLETVEDRAVFEFIETVPFPSQVLATSRRMHSELGSVSHIELPAISEKSSTQLLQRELALTPGQASVANLIQDQASELGGKLKSLTLGNPLAIKWAAAQLRAVPIASLITSIETGRGDLFRSMFDTTWNTLSSSSRKALEVITYFKAPPTISAALAVATLQSAADDVLKELSDSKLLEPSAGGSSADEARIALHPLTQAFAIAKLAELPADQKNILRRGYVRYHEDSLRSIGGRDWDDPRPFAAIDSERDNYVQAASLAAEAAEWRSVVTIVDGLRNYLLIYGYWGHRLQLCRLALRAAQALDDAKTTAQFHRHIGWTMVLQGNLDEATANLRIAKDIAVSQNDLKVQADAIGDLAEIARLRGAIQAARSLRTESLRLSKLGGNKRDIYVEQTLLAQMDLEERRLEAAHQGFSASMQLAAELRWHRAIAYCLHWLGEVARLQGNFREAHTYLSKSREYLAPFHDRARLALILKSEALLLAQQGDAERSRTLAKEAVAELQKLGLPYELHELKPLVKD